ncbi:MAG TPA: ATP synthase F1 subunit epsilon [Actinomycetota bacterium]
MPVEVHLVTPEREVWVGEAAQVTARGVDGDVGILVGHAPLLVQLAIGPLFILREGQPELAAVIDGGFMHVASRDGVTRVDVMATHAELASEIDLAAARRRLEAAQQRSDKAADLEIAKATARIGLLG